MFDACPIGNGPQFEPIIEQLDINSDVYKVLIAESSIPLFKSTLQANYFERMSNSRGSQLDSTVSKDAYALFLAAGFTNLIEWWIVNDKPISKANLLTMFEDITKKVFL